MRRAMLLLFAAWLVSAQPTGSIHGIVKDQYSGAPIADYSIPFTRDDGVHSGEFANATIDDDGHYFFGAKYQCVIRRVHIQAGDAAHVFDQYLSGESFASGRSGRYPDHGHLQIHRIGAAGKLGSAHVMFWLQALLLFEFS
jgi:hypothetical protein